MEGASTIVAEMVKQPINVSSPWYWELLQSQWLFDFSVNFAADAVVALILVLILQKLLDRSKRPQSVVMLAENGRSVMSARGGDGSRTFATELAVKNDDSRAPLLHGIYWHIFVPKHIEFEYDARPDVLPDIRRNEDGAFVHIYGRVDKPIFPTRIVSTGITIRCTCKKEPSQLDKIYYYVSTEFGLYPNTVKEKDEKSVFPDIAGLSSIDIR